MQKIHNSVIGYCTVIYVVFNYIITIVIQISIKGVKRIRQRFHCIQKTKHAHV